MYAIEINHLTKSFKGLYALNDFSMHVPQGAIYGFIGENGSGKSTTEKLICGHLVKDSGEIKLFGRPGNDPGVRARIGALIENAGCFPSSSIYQNLKMQAINLGLKDPESEINRVLKTVRMDSEYKRKFKDCSLGMKQRVGIAMALLGEPALLILDEPINGLDSDGCRLMREILLDIVHDYGCTVLISSHILGELEKIATHYGIIRSGHMIEEISASEMDSRHEDVLSVTVEDSVKAYELLKDKYEVKTDGNIIHVYDAKKDALEILLENRIRISEIKNNHIVLEEYYTSLMEREGK